MSTYTIVGNESIIIDDQLVTDTVTGDTVKIEYQGDISNFDMGKNKDAVIAFDANGLKAVVTLRVVTGGETDRRLRNKITRFVDDPPSFVLFTAEITGRFGDGQGNIRNMSFKLGAGHPKNLVPYVANASGDTEQAITTFQFNFVTENVSFE